jgi:hypothetical protein
VTINESFNSKQNNKKRNSTDQEHHSYKPVLSEQEIANRRIVKRRKRIFTDNTVCAYSGGRGSNSTTSPISIPKTVSASSIFKSEEGSEMELDDDE